MNSDKVTLLNKAALLWMENDRLEKELKDLRRLALFFRIAHTGYPASEARYNSVAEFIDEESKYER